MEYHSLLDCRRHSSRISWNIRVSWIAGGIQELVGIELLTSEGGIQELVGIELLTSEASFSDVM